MGRPQADQNPQAAQCPPENSQVPQHPQENPATCPPQSPEKPGQFTYQHPQAAAYPPQPHPSQGAEYPPQPQPHAVPFPPNAQPYVNQPDWKPQPVNFPPASRPRNQNVSLVQGLPYQQQPQGQAAFLGYGAYVGTLPWTTGLFDCMEDPTNTLITACFPCVTFGQLAEILDNGMTPCATSGVMYGVVALLGVPCILSCGYRTRLRAKYNLLESPAPDLFTHFLCECCALCQEYRELKNRGLDPGIGWQANMMLQAQQQVAMTPPTQQAMFS